MSRRAQIVLASENGLYPSYLGGTEIRARELVEHLRRSYDISVLTRRELTTPAGRTWSAPVEAREPARALRAAGSAHASVGPSTSALRWVAARRLLRAALLRLQPDLIYVHKVSSLHSAIANELLLFRRPKVIWFGDRHGARLAPFSERNWVRRLVFGAPRPSWYRDVSLIFNCRFLQRFYADAFGPGIRQSVIYDGVDVRRFYPASTPPTPVRFLFLGRTEGAKGFLDFCRAMASLPRSLVGSIEIIGDGPLLDAGLRIMRAGGRTDLLSRVGARSRAEVQSRLRDASVLVSPSEDEGLSGSVLEAMASGLAVIASDVGGTAEIVREGETGLLVPPGDVSALIRRCSILAQNSDLRQRLGRSARRLIAARYDLASSLAEKERVITQATVLGSWLPPAE